MLHFNSKMFYIMKFAIWDSFSEYCQTTECEYGIFSIKNWIFLIWKANMTHETLYPFIMENVSDN